MSPASRERMEKQRTSETGWAQSAGKGWRNKEPVKQDEPSQQGKDGVMNEHNQITELDFKNES